MKKAILLMLLLTSSLHAATAVNWYVDKDAAGGGDGTIGSPYQTLNACNTAKACDLAGTDVQVTIHCGASNTADSTACDFSGWTNGSATCYLRILVDDPALGVRDATKYRLVTATDYGASITNLPAYTRIEGLQGSNTGADGNFLVSHTTNAYLKISRCVIYATSKRGIWLKVGNSTVENCIIMGCSETGLFINESLSGLNVVNCTFANNTDGSFADQYTTVAYRNCYAGGSSSNDYETGAGSNFTYPNSYSEDGTKSTSTIAFTTSHFTNVTGGSENMHLVTASGAIGVGADVSAYLLSSIDIDSESRPMGGSWDVGYDEYTEASAAKPYYYMRNQ